MNPSLVSCLGLSPDGFSALPEGGAAFTHVWWTLLLSLVLCCAAARGNAAEPPDEGLPARSPILAGTWYEGDRTALARSVDRYLEGEGRPELEPPPGWAEASDWVEQGRHPIAVIVPHAGHAYSGACAGRGFHLLRGSDAKRVVLIGPSHRHGFTGAALPAEPAFATPLGRIPLDTTAIAALARREGFAIRPEAHAREHCLEIELPFLQRVLDPGFTLIPVVVGRLDPRSLPAVSEGIRSLLDAETILVVSSDFNHYGPNYGDLPFRTDVEKQLRRLDQEAIELIEARDPERFAAYLDRTDATICGAEPIRVLLHALRDRPLAVRTAEYYRSGDLIGDFENSVSYASIAFFPAEAATPPGPRYLDADEQRFLLDLARRTVRAVVRGLSLPSEEPPARFGADSPLREERGVFVTLTVRRSGLLRGCIGSIIGEAPLAAGVVHNAVASATRDPRFHPVEPNEEPDLEIEISVLTPLRRIGGFEEIVVGRHGVLLEKEPGGGPPDAPDQAGSPRLSASRRVRRAVFLPQVAPEQGWSRDEMLRHLALKAGLGPDDWKSGCTFHVFEAQVFGEEGASPPERGE